MYSKAVLSSFLYLPISEIDDVETLKRELTVSPKYAERDARIEMFNIQGGWFGVPLYHYRVWPVNEIIDKRTESKIAIACITKLWPKQEEVIRRFQEELKIGRTGFILASSPGTGKTLMAIKMISILKQRTLVIVPRSNLIKQWQERLLQHSDLKRSDIGWVEGGKGDWQNKKVVVALVHSVVLDRLGVGFCKSFGCVVFDEVDRSVPPHTFAPAVCMFPAKYRIGLSATLKRQDGMEVVFQKHIGQVLIKGSDEGRMKPAVLMHHFTASSGFVYAGSKRMNRRGMLISRLAANPLRNQLIAKYAYLIWKSGRKSVVLSDRKEQLLTIKIILHEQFKIPINEIGFYVRSLRRKQFTDYDRRKSASACKILLATYGMVSLGTDIPDLAGLVYATPQSEVIQSQGRIERFLDGKKTPVVIDLIDLCYGDCQRWAQKRMEYYRSRNLEIKVVS